MSYSSVLITGANGFVGSHLRSLLHTTCEEIYCLYVGQRPSQIYPQETWSEIDFFSEKEKLQEFLQSHSPQVIAHLASLVGIGSSIENPVSFHDVNATGTLNLLESIRKSDLDPIIVHAGSGAGYGTPQYLPVDEKHPLLPSSPYAASKVASEMITLAYHFSYGLNVTILRPFTLYGPGQVGSHLIPSVINQALEGLSPILVGNLWPKRNFCYISDIAKAFITAMSRGKELNGKIFNLGAEKSVEVRNVVELILKYSGRDWTDVKEDKRLVRGKTEIPSIEISIEAAKREMGWNPKVPLEEGIKLTVEASKRGIQQ